jgi:N-acetylmuramoyl-L-alanine amidase
MKIKYLLLLISGLSISSVMAESQCNFFAASGSIAKSALLVQGKPESYGFDSKKLTLVDQQINQDVKNGFPGAALLIIKDGHVIKQNVYGSSLKYDLKTGKPLAKPIPVECNTLFDLASNTKMYASNYAIMHLVADGKLDIDKPISFYLPAYKGCDKNGQCRETRTVRDLLTHSAGYMPSPQFYNPQNIAQYGDNLYSQDRLTTESIILNKLPFERARGGKPVYSDVDFMLLGMVIKAISKQSLDQYVAQNIYQPLGLKSVTFNPLLNGYNHKSCAATEVDGNTRGGSISFPNIHTTPIQCQVHDENSYYSMGGVSGHAGLFANLADMAVLMQLALNNGSYNKVTLWTPAVEAQFIAPMASDDTYGVGWRRAGSKNDYAPFGHYASNQAFGHTGWTGTLTLIDPKYDLAIVLLTNKKHSQYKDGKFTGDSFATGAYHQIIDLIYQSLDSNVKNIEH